MLLTSHSIINSAGIQITLQTFNLYFLNKPILFAASSTKWKVKLLDCMCKEAEFKSLILLKQLPRMSVMERQEQIEAINYVSINEHLKNQLSLSWFYIIINKLSPWATERSGSSLNKWKTRSDPPWASDPRAESRLKTKGDRAGSVKKKERSVLLYNDTVLITTCLFYYCCCCLFSSLFLLYLCPETFESRHSGTLF